jgi:hypothetical protein
MEHIYLVEDNSLFVTARTKTEMKVFKNFEDADKFVNDKIKKHSNIEFELETKSFHDLKNGEVVKCYLQTMETRKYDKKGTKMYRIIKLELN